MVFATPKVKVKLRRRINLKSRYPRKRCEEIEKKKDLKLRLSFYNRYKTDIVLDVNDLVRPVTEVEIRALRRQRRDRTYYQKNKKKIVTKKAENYWRKQLWRAKSLNTPFKGCNAHHITLDYVVYIPRELHQKHPHSLKHYFRMDVINNAVFDWLVSGEKNDIAAHMIEVTPPELLKRDARNFSAPY